MVTTRDVGADFDENNDNILRIRSTFLVIGVDRVAAARLGLWSVAFWGRRTQDGAVIATYVIFGVGSRDLITISFVVGGPGSFCRFSPAHVADEVDFGRRAKLWEGLLLMVLCVTRTRKRKRGHQRDND